MWLAQTPEWLAYTLRPRDCSSRFRMDTITGTFGFQTFQQVNWHCSHGNVFLRTAFTSPNPTGPA